jgi:hypothetical protein
MANTELQYVKKRITKLETDFGAFASLLIQAGIVEVKEEDGKQVFKVNKVVLNEQPEVQ